ncbi:MAG: hypothetical protein Q9167_006141 [Letrouitia subvulpina]
MTLPIQASSISSGELDQRARKLIRRLHADFARNNHKTSITTFTYNTAWVSMIRKTENGVQRWLFPEALDFMLERQLPDGGWQSFPLLPGELTSGIDGIVNTMAAIVALKTRIAASSDDEQTLAARVSRAVTALRRMFESWDFNSTDMVAFEVIVPAHLEMLEQHGLTFQFDARALLMKSYQQRMEKFRPEFLYRKEPTSLVYCLEAFVGKVDFDRVAHHKVAGSMFTSPSSTAAYLMNSSQWDDEAELYLRNAIVDGGFPDPYPTNIFEITWAMKALMEAFSRGTVISHEAQQIGDFLESTFHSQNGLVGWTPGVLDESDDTSSVIYVLNYLGRPPSPNAMILRYESSDKFRCFAMERNPSSGANAHILKALLSAQKPKLYLDQIVKAATYICNCWWKGDTSDKWNMTPHYSMMLSAQSLMMLVEKWDQGFLENFPKVLLAEKIRTVLFGLLVDTLQAQNHDGSWGPRQSRETTAYAIITLTTLSNFPLSYYLMSQLQSSVIQGKKFLQNRIHEWAEPDFIWRGKAIYGVAVISEAYTISAMSMIMQSLTLGKDVVALCSIEEPGMKRVQQISTLPFFCDMPDWLVRACTIEGYLYLPNFNQIRTKTFSRRDIKQHRQWNVLPFCAIACSRSKGGLYAPMAKLDFMIFCALTYEVDHYMEATITSLEGVKLEDVRQVVHEIFDEVTDLVSPNSGQNSPKFTENKGALLRIQNLEGIKSTLQGMTSYVLNHPRVTSASEYDQAVLRKELKSYFMAQITSNSESSSLALRHEAAAPNLPTPKTLQTYHEWVHTTSASHLGGLVTFAFMACLNNCNEDGLDSFSGAEAKYYAHDFSLHVASYGRMTNDIGSVERDRQESNLNSVDFLEFCIGGCDLEARTQQLQRLAEFEKEAYGRALERLRALGTEERKIMGMRAFSNMAELYAEIYAMEDITPRLAK